MLNLWENTPNQPSKFKAKRWIKLNEMKLNETSLS